MATKVLDEHRVNSVSPQNFYIFGQGISFSMSPTIHKAGFGHYGLPHTYEIHQTETVDELSSLINSPSFGGASVTMPHKIGISKFCASISKQAQTIGAVNTLIVKSPGDIIGDNTDWSGLASILKTKSQDLGDQELDTALVIGAGGASRAALYALHHIKVKKIYLYNRTRATAESIAASYAALFPITVIDSLQVFSSPEFTAPKVIIGTIPANKTSIDMFPRELFAKSEGICIDMAYLPRFTPLIDGAQRYGKNWSTVAGVDVLLEQAFDQFKLWIGKEAPRSVMVEALRVQDAKNAAARETSILES